MGIIAQIGEKIWDYIGERLEGDELYSAAKEYARDGVEDVDTLDKNHLQRVLASGVFIEWLWFEYKIPGDTVPVLVSFANDVKNLDDGFRNRLEQLIKTNHYALWRVGEHRPGDIAMKDLKNGTTYHVNEYKMAEQVSVNDCVYLRIAQQDGRWEIVSADGAVPINIANEDDAVAIADSLSEPVSIKNSTTYMNDINTLFPDLSRGHRSKSLVESRRHFDEMLLRSGLDAYISRQTFERWVKESKLDKRDAVGGKMPMPIALVFGLAGGVEGDNIAEVNDVLRAASELMSAVQNKGEKVIKAGNTHLKMESVNLVPWQHQLDEAKVAQRVGNKIEAVELWEGMFGTMLDTKGITKSLYRYYANAAVAYLVTGDVFLGERLLDIALEIYPDYDFALDQKNRLKEGEFSRYSIASLAEKIQSGKISIPTPVERVLQMTDDEIIESLSELGVHVDPDTFDKTIADTTALDDLLVKKWGFNPEEQKSDRASSLAIAAAIKWAPNHVWPETLQYFADKISQALRPEFEGEKRSLAKAARLMRQLNNVLQNATTECGKAWAQSHDYFAAREGLVLAGVDVVAHQNDTRDMVLELYSKLLKLTKDPLFMVDEILISDKSQDEIIEMIESMAKMLPLDNYALAVLGDELPADKLSAKERAYVRALDALERRRHKKLNDYMPYDRSDLHESYLWVLDALCNTYAELGRYEDDDKYTELYGKVADGIYLKDVPKVSEEELAERREKYFDDFIYAKSNAIKYYKWYKTLGIDLSTGDGVATTVRVYRSDGVDLPKKIGRNDPCPCGKTKADGTPVKFKKCHGKY